MYQEPKATPVGGEQKKEEKFSREDADQLLTTFPCCRDEIDPEQFHMGMNIELEHGTQDPDTNVTNDDPKKTAKIAIAHIKEIPDYYTRLKKMEDDYENEKNQGKQKPGMQMGENTTPAEQDTMDAGDFMLKATP